jgi:hypothetical protein
LKEEEDLYSNPGTTITEASSSRRRRRSSSSELVQENMKRCTPIYMNHRGHCTNCNTNRKPSIRRRTDLQKIFLEAYLAYWRCKEVGVRNWSGLGTIRMRGAGGPSPLWLIFHGLPCFDALDLILALEFQFDFWICVDFSLCV